MSEPRDPIIEYVERQVEAWKDLSPAVKEGIAETQQRVDYLIEGYKKAFDNSLAEANTLGKNLSNNLVVITGFLFSLLASVIAGSVLSQMSVAGRAFLLAGMICSFLSICFRIFHYFSELRFWQKWISYNQKSINKLASLNWNSINDVLKEIEDDAREVPTSSKDALLYYQIIFLIAGLLSIVGLVVTSLF